MTSYIYKTTNLINGKTYVGQYTGCEFSFNYYMGGGTRFRKALKKYGKNNFKKEIILQGVFNKDLLNSLEIHYIQLYSPALTSNSYNLDIGGSTGSTLIKPVLQYSMNGIFIKGWESASEASKVLKIYKTNIVSASNGIIGSAGGFLWSYTGDNIKDKIERLSNLSEKASLKHSKIPIYIYDNSEWKIFPNTVKAAKFVKGTHAQILRCINTEKGYHWYKGILVSKFILDKIPESEYLKRKPIVHKKINQYTLDGKLIKMWENRHELYDAFDGKVSGIYRNCIGKNKTGYGFIWQYA